MKKFLLPLLLVIAVGAAVAYRMWNKPHKDMANAKTDVTLAASDLFQQFNTDETAANTQYLDKTVAVTGAIQEVIREGDVVKLNLDAGDPDGFGVLCELDPLTAHSRTDFAAGENVTLKGICAGFNLDVQLVRCVEVK